jgi:hypothetical protein
MNVNTGANKAAPVPGESIGVLCEGDTTLESSIYNSPATLTDTLPRYLNATWVFSSVTEPDAFKVKVVLFVIRWTIVCASDKPLYTLLTIRLPCGKKPAVEVITVFPIATPGAAVIDEGVWGAGGVNGTICSVWE